MNKILLPRITFKNIIADEKRIEIAYSRLFEIARRNILVRKGLTDDMSQEYTRIQNERRVSDYRGSSAEAACQQTDSLPLGRKRADSGL